MSKTIILNPRFLSVLFLLAYSPSSSRGAEGFLAKSAPTNCGHQRGVPFLTRGGGTSLSEAASSIESVPSWDNLKSNLETIRKEKCDEDREPVLTLYRDTNGWCPFCERVWVAIRAKGLPYQETLVPLQGKPEWYKQMVPTGLVPAVLFHGDDSNNTSRELIWESDSILQALDDKFPDTLRLMRSEDTAFQEGLERQSRLQAAGFKFAYGNRNGTLSEAEIEENRSNFEAMLDEMDGALSGGGFALGDEFSGVDAIMIPTLERWRYQLPLTENLDILDGRPNLQKWFEHLDSFPAYSGRVAGDEYSWTATASMFLRYFGGGEDKPKVAAGIVRADAAAEELAKKFKLETSMDKASALEAASKLISNYEAILNDCLRDDPKSQAHIPRGDTTSRETVDALLRHVAFLLLKIASGSQDSCVSIPNLVEKHTLGTLEHPSEGSLALQTVSKRLCVPRDMGAPAAALLRGILATVASSVSSLETEVKEAVA